MPIKHRPLKGNSQEFSNLKDFQAAVKARNLTADFSKYKGHGANVVWVYENGKPVGYISRWHHDDAGFISPNFEALLVDWVDELVRSCEEISAHARRIFPDGEDAARPQRARDRASEQLMGMRESLSLRRADTREWKAHYS